MLKNPIKPRIFNAKRSTANHQEQSPERITLLESVSAKRVQLQPSKNISEEVHKESIPETIGSHPERKVKYASLYI